MDLFPLAFGVSIWAGSLAFYIVYRARLDKAWITDGIVTDLQAKWPQFAEAPSTQATITYQTRERQHAVFRSVWKSEERQYRLGENVKVKIIDGKPSVYDRDFAFLGVTCGIVAGLCFVIGPFLRPFFIR